MPRAYPPIPHDRKTHALSPSVIESVAGFTAGVVATLAVHPFDVLKTRLQLKTSQAQWGNSFRILRQITRDEGSYAALYRGLMPNMVGNSISWALYFLWYRNLKDAIQVYRGPNSNLTSLDYFASSGASGILTAIFTNPIWVIKTRMLSSGRNAPGAYKSMSHGIREIMRTEGPKGFWRGLVPSLFGISHGAVQFAAYEQLKNRRGGQLEGGKSELSNWDYLLLSGASKIFAGSITYPYQVVRVRLQTYDAERTYKGTGDAVKQIWKKEGVKGFYKGLVPNVVRVLPSTCVTFLVYENTKFYLPMWYGEEAAKYDV
ncbi:solute carrier family 25 protein [Tothia fuscella]|uniref:Solute carrier family 25 protein n=1 Tax=Tothia fuscella TaxID=1048955 RepID=A0A9P4NEC0_9PEZI|nr:solute carrier family 25 protein [Tothia fuscella]